MSLPAELEAKLAVDIQERLTPDGKPVHPGNDYELHLMARKLQLSGMDAAAVAIELLPLVVHVPSRQRMQYVADILDSALVGFSNRLPVFVEGEAVGVSPCLQE